MQVDKFASKPNEDATKQYICVADESLESWRDSSRTIPTFLTNYHGFRYSQDYVRWQEEIKQDYLYPKLWDLISMFGGLLGSRIRLISLISILFKTTIL
jgi:hypothetical protein